MDIVEISIGSIKPYESNPRINDASVDFVAESIKQFGFKQPIVLDKNGVIVAGHTRYRASLKLGLESVPCVIADDLTKEQIKAYRLADNKVAEASQWNESLLDMELASIIDIDMSDFGFEPIIQYDYNDETEDDYTDEESEESEDYYGSERERTFEAYNLYDIDLSRCTKKWQMPILKKCDHVPEDLISFNYAKTSQEFNKGIHFYIDDYQFERIWNKPHDYIEILKQFDCVLTPDFSLYTEMPLPMQIWNVFRSKLIGQILQDNGINVIPTLQWCRADSFDFAFDGIEQGGVVSVSTIGVKREESASKLWFDGMNEAMARLKPHTVVVYGGDIGFDYGTAKVVYIGNHNAERIGGKQ